MGKTASAEDLAQTGLNAIPLHLGDPDAQNPNLDLIGDDDDDIDPGIAALQGQFDEFKETAKEQTEFLQNTILEMSQRPAQVVAAPVQDQPTTITDLDLKDLPDHVENHGDFLRVLGERVTKFVGDRDAITTAAVTAQGQTATGLQDLENRFTRDYKTLADKPILFQASVTQAVAKLKNRGLDPQQFIFADPNKFLEGIAKSMNDELGIEEGDEDDDNVVDLKPVKKVSRTKGVKSGSMPQLKKGGKGEGKKTLSFVQEIRKQQHAMGLI